MRLYLFIMTVLIILCLQYKVSQAIDCPSGLDWTSSSVGYSFGDYGPGGEINYERRFSGGNYEIKIDWISYQNNSDFMPDDAMKRILEIEAVRAVVPNYNIPYDCDVYVYFERECKVKVKLVLELERGAEVTCSDDGVNFCQDWYEMLINGKQHSFFNIYKYINCGYKCCARIYHCSRNYDVIRQLWVTSVNLTSTVSISTCSGPTNYRDCLSPNDFLPCEDGSCDGYY